MRARRGRGGGARSGVAAEGVPPAAAASAPPAPRLPAEAVGGGWLLAAAREVACRVGARAVGEAEMERMIWRRWSG